jgi:uncharacterized membrane protein
MNEYEMVRDQQPALTLFAIGMAGLGILALIYGDSGVIMLLTGAGLLFRTTAAWSIRILFPYLILWLLLKVPAVVVAPQMEAVWLGIGELAMLMAGGWVLFASLARIEKRSMLAFAAGERGIAMARILFAVALIPVGLSHIVYVKQTVELVPAWLPFRTAWAYLTGVGQMACGVGLLLSIFPRVAAIAEAGMLTLFTLLVWLPAILAKPAQRMPWTAFFISWAIASAAWVIAREVPARKA